jgi:biotin carboxyl carrier protein
MNDALLARYIEKARSLGLTGMRINDGAEEIEFSLRRQTAKSVAQASVAEVVSAKSVDITSSFVGYFRPVAGVQTKVNKGDVVASVESLGLPNDVLAPTSGELQDFMVEDGDAVQYGTLLAKITT